ncbi:MAG: glucan biosynthesis protein, partial [Planctomycetota bacterium]
RLVYDIQFYLYTISKKVSSKEDYLEVYPDMIAFGDGEFSTGGYAPHFVEDWITDRLSQDEIVTNPTGTLEFSDEFLQEFMRKVNDLK